MAALSPAVAHHRARVAAMSRAVRNGERPAADLDRAKRDFNAAKIADYIRRALAEAPPLTDEQRVRLADLLRPARKIASSRAAVVAERVAELDGGAGA